jgi:hypothetical protein
VNLCEPAGRVLRLIKMVLGCAAVLILGNIEA